MIKLPKNVSKAMKSLETAGFEVYCTGECVRDSLLGMCPLDWDMITNAGITDLKTVFPEGKVLSEKCGAVRLDFTEDGNEEEVIIDIAAYSGDSAEDDLAGRDFTINAIAVNPGKPVIDPYRGIDDIKNKLVRTVGEPKVTFERKPMLILSALRICAELNFDLPKAVYEAAQDKANLLDNASADERREEFKAIIGAKYAGKGLRMLAGINAMPAIIGREVAEGMRKRELDDFAILTENIEKTLQVAERRLGLFYMCFDKGKALKAIDVLKYDGKLLQYLTDSAVLMPKVYFIKTKQELKGFLVKYGSDRYEYLHNLAKAHRIVYGLDEHKVMSRIFLMDQIKMFHEPIFVEDLAIDGNDIIEAGIASGDKVGKLLLMLTDYVHKHPAKNTRDELMKVAKSYARIPLMGSLRKVNWLR